MRQKDEDGVLSEQVSIHLKPDEKRRLEEIARLERRPVGQLGRILIQNYLKGYHQNGSDPDACDVSG